MKTPEIIYGTAWKQEATAALVEEAVLMGFRAIDTANQKKHYREDYVGDALLTLQKHGIHRKDLFLQSKYTYVEGQDERLPYNPKDNYATQVRSSFGSTLKNLHTEYLDSYLLHGPRSGRGLVAGDWEVWGVFEELYESERTKMIGVSNVGLHHLVELCSRAKIKPQVVQNRCFAIRGWDREVREFCLANGIIYEGFSLLTANPHVVNDPRVIAIANRLDATPEQVVLKFTTEIGILPLSGTTDPQHMKDDLNFLSLELTEEDMIVFES